MIAAGRTRTLVSSPRASGPCSIMLRLVRSTAADALEDYAKIRGLPLRDFGDAMEHYTVTPNDGDARCW